MAARSFDEAVRLKILPIPGLDVAVLARTTGAPATAQLGNMIAWISTGVSPARRPYFHLILADGLELNPSQIEALSRGHDFKSWLDRRRHSETSHLEGSGHR